MLEINNIAESNKHPIVKLINNVFHPAASIKFPASGGIIPATTAANAFVPAE